jgi:acyl carrier protein
MSEILNEITPIIAEKLGVDPSEVTMEASFTNDLGADSLDTVELMMEFEKTFGLTIPDDQQENITTVGDVVRLIEKMRAEKE